MCTLLLFFATIISLYLCYRFNEHYKAADAAIRESLYQRSHDGRLRLSSKTQLYYCVEEEFRDADKYLDSETYNVGEVWKLTFFEGSIIYGILAFLSFTGALAASLNK